VDRGRSAAECGAMVWQGRRPGVWAVVRLPALHLASRELRDPAVSLPEGGVTPRRRGAPTGSVACTAGDARSPWVASRRGWRSTRLRGCKAQPARRFPSGRAATGRQGNDGGGGGELGFRHPGAAFVPGDLGRKPRRQ
jgi:hypothetical protein